ncbi:hypothetical protein ASG01_08815 [Chryseobacterium sp. Leaf180]|uniref:hypothetical protein n=1 Tax=Chryseobacterium sp. Leaf180 TaxID=1736289 RepID=UPI0006FE4145|nr:hypothetical protein [Chryseobacterium sp. Leaf180]KQR93289.1 hypothetical protein ASG01_08815 [Chryseobacterium sp. Leaf180]
MQRFWYHSPVRFYKTIEELEDMTNPQNTQFFGTPNAPYPLEVNEYHRFLIPDYQNEIESEDLELWLIGETETQIACQFGVGDNKLTRITFISFESLHGRFEIRSGGETLFYSNCVRFLESTDDCGRKYIRIATKHYYNRNLFTFYGDDYDWMITNLPAYCMGIFDIDEDVDIAKNGSNSIINDAWIEENVSYEFDLKGDNNILTFLSVHSTNNEFYIDGTKRVRKEKPEAEEFSAKVVMKFANQKDSYGMNIFLDEKVIFADVMKQVLGNELKTIIYAFSGVDAIKA